MPILSVSGLRGIIGRDLTLKELMDTSEAFAHFIKSGKCIVGRDTRSSGYVASQAVVAALLGQGCIVEDFGMISTPAVFREVARGHLDGGISITASHNPPEWNGLKFVVAGGRGISEEELNQLKQIRSFNEGKNHFSSGRYVKVENTSYPNDVVTYAGKGVCRQTTVALDLGGGVGCLFAPGIMKKLGCKTVTLHSTPGIFQRIIDPTSDDLSALSRFVVAQGCDVGFAYDCDADRVVVVDQAGKKLSPDYTLLICLKHLINSLSERRIVVSVDTSMAVDELVHEAGGRVYRTKVGEVNVSQGMLKVGSRIGGEGSSGGLIVSDFALCRDGVLASAIITKIVKDEGSLKNVLERLPKYHQIRRKVHCARQKLEKIDQELSTEKGMIDRIDGLRIKFRDSSWLLIRSSRTEDVLRISVEAKDRVRAEALMNEYITKVKHLSEDNI